MPTRSRSVHQPDHEHDEVHTRRRDDRAGAAVRRRTRTSRSWCKTAESGSTPRRSTTCSSPFSRSLIPAGTPRATFASTSGAGSGALHRQEICRAALGNNFGGVPRRGRDADYRAAAEDRERASEEPQEHEKLDAHCADRGRRTRGQQAAGDAGAASRLSDGIGSRRRRRRSTVSRIAFPT